LTRNTNFDIIEPMIKKNPFYLKIKKIASARGGKVISGPNDYKNMRTKLVFKCKEKHQWESAPHSIAAGKWCPQCAVYLKGKRSKISIDTIKDIAKNRRGKLISKRYKNAQANLIWECVKGHRWKASLSNVKNKGSWCPECSKKPTWLSFKEAKKFTEKLKLKSVSQWKMYCKGEIKSLPPKPNTIPAAPARAYKDKGWANWGDFLGHTYTYYPREGKGRFQDKLKDKTDTKKMRIYSLKESIGKLNNDETEIILEYILNKVTEDE
jgi:hypothetical protein